jgi:Cu+-exporting ATPase
MAAAAPQPRDPVCGMTPRADTPHRAEHAGHTYLFCSAHCAERFRAAPESFLAPREPAPPAAAGPRDGRRYTCPMHPEIVRDEPGDCPICGMALEPLEPSAEEGDSPELRDMERRFRVSAVLTLPVFLIAMGDMLPGAPVEDALGVIE